MLESIGVIIIVTFLIIVAVSFYNSLERDEHDNRLKEQNKLGAIEVVKRVTDLPELQCSNVEVVTIGCFDTYKLDAFTTLAADDDTRLFYFPLLRNSLVVVHPILPSGNDYVIYNNTELANRSAEPFFIPVALYDPISRTNSFGVLEVVAEYE